jgi:uncharacterized protein
VDLWNGSLKQFLNEAGARSLTGHMLGQFYNAHGRQPSPAESNSWARSLGALADTLRPLKTYDMGVAVTADASAQSGVRERPQDPAGVALEYHLPYNGKRVDVLLTGRDRGGQESAVVLELKQWDRVTLRDEYATNVMLGGEEHVHPCEQALDYAEWLSDYHSAFTDDGVVARPAAYCHDMLAPHDGALRDGRFRDLLARSPLFTGSSADDLAEFVEARVGCGGGLDILHKVTAARFKPSKRVLDALEDVLREEDAWHLLSEQRLAFNAIRDEVKRRQAKAGHSVILVRGGPGTGKTVIAVQLLAAALRNGWGAAHSTGGKAFTTALQSRFKGADGLFIWNLTTRNAPTHAYDLLLVDEAHRVRKTSDTRFTKAAERNRCSQAEELINASKVTVFLLDENQFVRPDEVGSSELIREESRKRRATFSVYDLETQFRCGGCAEYTQWVDWLLGFSADRPSGWGDRYRLELARRPEDLDALIEEGRRLGHSARSVAGFCWPWSDPTSDNTLLDDVTIGTWQRPWNRKAPEKARFTPANHPYTRWAQTTEGESQVGCIYSAQGFEFDWVGVIWGEDLVWREGEWIAQKAKSFDRPVKSSKDMQRLVRNAYRVLLTRGLRGARVLVLDEETRQHVGAAIAACRELQGEGVLRDR